MLRCFRSETLHPAHLTMSSAAQSSRGREEILSLLRGTSVCFCCRKAEGEGQRFMYCGGCEFAYYCSKECQRAHWPKHRSDCKRKQAYMAAAQAQGQQDRAEHFQEWLAQRRVLLSRLAEEALVNRSRTHVVDIRLGHYPNLAQPLQIQDIKTVPMSELPNDMVQYMHATMSAPPVPLKEHEVVGFVVIRGSGVMQVQAIPTVLEDVKSTATSGDLSGHILLLNADLDWAVTLVTSTAANTG